jgi:hypothetical protein
MLTKTYQNDLGVKTSTYFGFFRTTFWQKTQPEKLFGLDVSWELPRGNYRPVELPRGTFCGFFPSLSL